MWWSVINHSVTGIIFHTKSRPRHDPSSGFPILSRNGLFLMLRFTNIWQLCNQFGNGWAIHTCLQFVDASIHCSYHNYTCFILLSQLLLRQIPFIPVLWNYNWCLKPMTVVIYNKLLLVGLISVIAFYRIFDNLFKKRHHNRDGTIHVIR